MIHCQCYIAEHCPQGRSASACLEHLARTARQWKARKPGGAVGEEVAAWSGGVRVVPRAGARTVENGQRDLVDPAVNGTKNVLGAVAKSLDTVKRVVLTSSFAGALAAAMRLHRSIRVKCCGWHSRHGLLGLCFFH